MPGCSNRVGVQLADQTLVFLQACLVGAALGLLYDAFRISRIALPTPAAVVFVEDLVFFLACAVVTFFFLLSAVDGRVRVFLMAGEILGAVLYHVSLGVLVMGVSKTIINVIRAILRFLFRWILYPVWRLVYHIVAFLIRPFLFLGQIVRKCAGKAKFSLKVRRRLLYNHCKGLLRTRVSKRSKGKRRHAQGKET